MTDFLKRCLAFVLVLSLVLSTGVVSAIAATVNSAENAAVLDMDNVIIAEPDNDYELIQDTLEESMNKIDGFSADLMVVFIVELEGQSLLDTKPAGQAVSEYMVSSAGTNAAKQIQTQQTSVQNQILRSRNGLKVEYTYQVVMNGLAVSGPYSAKAYLESIPGVASVTVANTYEAVEPANTYTQAEQTSGVMIDSDSANAAGYTGKGTVTAILDTGLDLTHSAFANAPEAPAMDKDDIQTAIDTGKLNAQGTADELYKSEKIPFAYDYTATENATEVTDPQRHGTHVAGTVGADCAEFSGVAPDTQLVILKVFDAEGGGATDAVIFAALEDAVVLGVDAINMSLGTPSGFTYENEATEEVYGKIKSAGINLMVSAGNDTDSTSNTNLGTNLPLVSEPDNAIVGSPSTYEAAMSVASVNEYSDYVTYLLSGERKISFADGNAEKTLDFVKKFNGQTLEYAVVSGFGASVEEFTAAGVEGKLALVSRGEVNFADKEANAATAGAVGIVVYDNVEGDLVYMQSAGKIPAVFISKADGLALRDQETKTISVSTGHAEFVETADGGLMSDFSSMGVAPDMTLKPEITAPGGYIYSTLPGGGYGSMSGTSMASPHMAGAAAVLQQYVDTKFPALTEPEKRELINTLLMNTAVPVEDENGVAYTPRKQGAGLAQVNSAINTGAYVTVDGSERPKAELGDSANGYFSKEVTLTVHNLTDAELTYDMSAIALTAKEEEVNVQGVLYQCISDNARIMPQDQFQVLFSEDTVTVPANGTASVTVKLRLTEAGEASLAAFVNGTFLDGFIVLESTEENGIDLSVPYLGFYGDWGQASVFDNSVYDEEAASVYPSAMALLSSEGSGFYMGSNIYSEDASYDINKIAVSREMLAYGYRPYTLLGLLRAPKTLTYTVTDAEGKALELFDELTLNSMGTAYTVENVLKSFFHASGNFVNYEIGPTRYGWNAIVDLGDGYYSYLPDGQYYINATAKVDGTESPAGTQAMTFPITIDSAAPQLLSTDHEKVDGKDLVTLDLYDNHYIMAFQVIAPDGLSAFSPVMVVDEAEPGTTSSFTFNVSGLLAEGHTSACVMVYDYALNDYVSYEFSLEADTLQPARVTINNQIHSVSGSQTFEIEAWIEPENLAAEDRALTWTSSDESVATVKALEKTRYDEDSNVTFYCAEVTTYNVSGPVTITVSTVNGKSSSITFNVIGSYDTLPDDYVIRKDGTYLIPEDLDKQVTITDEARNVTVVGNPANTKDDPYKDLSFKSEITEGLNLTIRDLNITSTRTSTWGTTPAAPTITFTGKGNTLTLAGESTFVGVAYGSYALVQVDGTASGLTVDGSGTLNLYQPGSTYGAALGGQAGYSSGEIVINGGNLNITAEGSGAGIGGGSGANAPSITINGGNIDVNVPYASAGWSYNTNSTGAGIGSGNGVSGGSTNVVINGGNVTATTSTNSAAIGGALYNNYNQSTETITVTINGGKVVAKTLDDGATQNGGGAAIGSSYYGGTANVYINGGEVIAVTETAAAAIGSGYSAKKADITVKGGTVSAFADNAINSEDYRGPGVGSGVKATAGYIYIDKGAVITDNTASVYNSDMTPLTEVTMTIPGIKSLTIDGVDWKVSANHADFTAEGGTDYSDEVHVWLAASNTPYTVAAQTEDGTERFELYTSGLAYEFHNVEYVLTGLSTDGPAKVYDPSAGENYSADLTGTLALESRTTMKLPTSISVTVNGEAVTVDYNAQTGAFAVAKELLTGDVVLTAAAEEVVDKTTLNALIAQVEGMDSSPYTGDSWAALQTALEAAKAAAAAEPTTQAAVDAAYQALKAAVDALAVRADISELEALIAEADKLEEAAYVSDTWAALQTALEAAKAVAADTNATEAQVTAALEALQAAMDALVNRGDKTALRAAIDEADVLFEKNYTPESWTDSGLEKALEDAIAVYADPDATQTEVDAAELALRAAVNKLLQRADTSALLEMVQKARALTAADYTQDSWAALSTALAAGQALLEDPNALQTDIDAAAAALQRAIADLVPLGDSTALKEAIAKAEGLTEETYTPETWEKLEEALEAAKEAADGSNASQEDMDNAKKALEDAIAALVERADTTALAALIAEAEAIEDEGYTTGSWERLQNALAEAKETLADPNASQGEVNAAAATLRNAMDTLSEAGDKSALQAAYDKYSALVESAYTAESWEVLESALAAAKSVLENPYATQEWYDASLEELEKAAAALVRAGDSTALKALVEQAQKNLGNYTDSSAKIIEEAIKAAQDAINARADQETISKAYDALTKALAEGEKKPTASGTPTNPTNPKDPTVPSTGDGAPLAALILLVCLSGFGIALCVPALVRKKK